MTKGVWFAMRGVDSFCRLLKTGELEVTDGRGIALPPDTWDPAGTQRNDLHFEIFEPLSSLWVVSFYTQVFKSKYLFCKIFRLIIIMIFIMMMTKYVYLARR